MCSSRRAGTKELRQVDLRDLSQGVHPKVVQERLGHAQISLTLDTYSHVLASMGREAADRLEQLLRTPTAGAPGSCSQTVAYGAAGGGQRRTLVESITCGKPAKMDAGR